MNEESLEELSALIDGCLPKEAVYRLLDLSIRDPNMQAAWMRYHLIGDALRYNLPKNTSLDLARRVSLVLEREPTLLAPRQRPWKGVIPIVGLAIAASMAVVAVLSLQRVDKGTGEPGSQQVAEQETLNTLPVSTVRWDSQPSPSSPRLNSYLLNHNQYNSSLSLSMQGVSPYVRIVSYESGQ